MSRRIAILSEDFPPYSGGIAQWALGIAGALNRQGHSVILFTRHRADYEIDTSIYAFEIHQIHGEWWRQLRSWYYYRALRSYFENHSVDLIIATTWNVARGVTGMAEKQSIPLITVIHGLEVTRRMTRLKSRWLRQTLMASKMILAVSQFTRDQAILMHKLPGKKVRVFPNGVDAGLYTPAESDGELRSELGLYDEQVILTLARVIERKGHDQVIRALPRVVEVVPNVKYVIAGPWDTDYYNHLRRLIQTLNLSSFVLFTGYLNPRDLVAYFNLCDVYIMLSQTLKNTGDTEGFGITFLEANACEKPVIGGRTGGVVDAIKEGKTGFLVDPHDTDAIADRLICLLKDPELARRMGQQGRERILKSYTWDVIAANMMTSLSSG